MAHRGVDRYTTKKRLHTQSPSPQPTRTTSTKWPIQHEFQTSNGGPKLTYFEWRIPFTSTVDQHHQEEEEEVVVQPQQVVLLHATGFHARCWDQTIHALHANRLNNTTNVQVYAVDMRGHGRSQHMPIISKAESESKNHYEWDKLSQDIKDLIDHLQIKNAIGVGHSMGGHCLTRVAAEYPNAFKNILLIDPLIMEPHAYQRYIHHISKLILEEHPVAKRRNKWKNWMEMYQRLKQHPSFKIWNDDVLRDYCRYGLVPNNGGTCYELACPPLVEASLYSSYLNKCDIINVISTVNIPVTVLRAKGSEQEKHNGTGTDFALSPTWEGLAGVFPNGRDVYLPELTHFIPMQDPSLVARFIAEACNISSSSQLVSRL